MVCIVNYFCCLNKIGPQIYENKWVGLFRRLLLTHHIYSRNIYYYICDIFDATWLNNMVWTVYYVKKFFKKSIPLFHFFFWTIILRVIGFVILIVVTFFFV